PRTRGGQPPHDRSSCAQLRAGARRGRQEEAQPQARTLLSAHLDRGPREERHAPGPRSSHTVRTHSAEREPAMTSVIDSISTSADGYGRWRAKVEFSRTLSESDPREEFSLHHHWPTVRLRARKAIVDELVQREQKTGECRGAAQRPLTHGLPNLVVISQDIDSMNCWHGVTLGEP